jgi:tRNA-specific 2-thiouridylase
VGVDTKTATVLVGPERLLSIKTVSAYQPKWTSGKMAVVGSDVTIQMRAHGAQLPAKITRADDVIEVLLNESTRGVAPGQTLAIYDQDRVIGSGTITATGR